MLKPATITEQLIYSTVLIEIYTDDELVGTGTGFFYTIPAPQTDGKIGVPQSYPFLVTNKHVVENSTKLRLRMHTVDRGDEKYNPTGDFVFIDIKTIIGVDTDLVGWAFHPSPDVDLCLLPFAAIHEAYTNAGFEPYCTKVDAQNIPSSEDMQTFSAVEDVLMVGYPNGLYDNVNNLPLIRRGITASHPSIDYCGRSEGVVDLACFPGSSGSPIFISYEDRFAKRTETKNAGALYFLGVLYAGPVMDQMGEIEIRAIPTAVKPVSVTQTMIHLGYYIKATEVNSLAESTISSLLKRIAALKGKDLLA